MSVLTKKADVGYAKDLTSALSIYNKYRGTVRKMRIYNAKPIFKTITPVLTTLRKF